MMDRARDLFDYVYWMRDRMLAAAAQLTPAQFVDPETVGTRDLRATLVHELDVEWSWRTRLREGAFGPEDDLDPADFPTVEAIAMRWRDDEAEMRAWVDGLDAEALASPPPGEDDPFPLRDYVMHLVSHAIQQFSEAALLLTRAGRSPGDIGYGEYILRRPR